MVVTYDDIKYDLNGDVPRLFINEQECCVVSMTNHYLTRSCYDGVNIISFVYIANDEHPKQKIISINKNTGEVFDQ